MLSSVGDLLFVSGDNGGYYSFFEFEVFNVQNFKSLLHFDKSVGVSNVEWFEKYFVVFD